MGHLPGPRFWLSLAFCLYCTSYAASENGLIAHYTFDEGAGQVAKDVSGNGHDGQIRGAVYVPSPRGQALRFDGVDDCVELGSPATMKIDGDLTLEAWVRTDVRGKPAGDKVRGNWLIIGDAAGLTVLRNYNLRVDCYNKLRLEWGNHARYNTLLGEPSFLDGQWRHIAVVVESPSRAYLYVDGRLAKRAEIDLGITKTRGGPFRIGGWGHGFLKGEIDEIRLYRCALSLGEIRSHAGGATAKASVGLAMTAGFSYHQNAFHLDLFCDDVSQSASAIVVRVCEANGKVVATERIPAAEQTRAGTHRYAIARQLPVEAVKAGDYRVEATLVDAKGRTLATESAVVPCTERPQWLGSKIGITDEIPPPFEPLKVEQQVDAVAVRPWGRELIFGRAPFVSRIRSAGADLLAGPIRLTARADGRDVRWRGRVPKLLTGGPHGATLRQEANGDTMQLSISSDVEYDGFARIDWAIQATAPATLDQLVLVLPFAAAHAKYLHCWPVGHSGALKQSFSTGFKPIVWLGDEERGLCWVAESDENWSVRDREKAIQVETRGREVVLRLNLIDQPVRLEQGQKLTYTFGLHPTPVRPMKTTCWDIRLERQKPYADEYQWMTAKVKGRPALEHFAALGTRALCIWRWWDAFSYTLPYGHEQEFPKLVSACHAQGIKVIPYSLGFLLSEAAPECKHFKDDMICRPLKEHYIDRLPGLTNQMTYYACRKGAWQDFVVATVAECMDRYDIDGIYLDTTVRPHSCSNALHGCGYARPNGTRAPTYPIFATRQLMKRLYTVVTKRRADGIVDAHVYDCMNIPALAFATSYWNGEQLRREPERVLDALPLDRFRTEFMGHNWGVPADLLYYKLGNYTASAGLALLHDVPVRAESLRDLELLSEIWRVREAFGCKESEFLPYWRNADLVQVSPADCYVSLWRHPQNGLLAVVANLSRQRATVRATLSLEELQLPPVVSARNAHSQQQIAVERGAITVDLASQAWRLVWLRGER